MNLNKVLLIGNLTRDPELRTIPSGQSVATLGIATNRVWTNRETNQKQEQVEFHNVVCWGRLAELASQYLAKGRTVFIEGRLQTRSWQDQKTGEKRYRTEIVAEQMQFGPRPAGGNFQQPTNNSQQQTANNESAVSSGKSEVASAENLPVIQEDEPGIEVKDIPF